MSELAWVFEQGGWVSYALCGVSVLLWTTVLLRAMVLRPPSSLSLDRPLRGSGAIALFVREAMDFRGEPTRLDRLAERTLHRLGTMKSLISVLVAVAPLLGLLGTVNGMVEMFGSMQGALASEGDATVASGISTALVSTQLGLVIAAPGFIAAFWLSRQQLRRERDVHDLLIRLKEARS